MSSLKVVVRVRPFNNRELDMEAQPIVQMDGKKTRLNKPRVQCIRDNGRENYHDYTFDYSYWSFDDKDSNFATQEQVYTDLGTDVVDCAFEGYNACVFAYGQTGSGKTFTMMGAEGNLGLIPRICEALFNRMKIGQESGTGYKTHVSYLEIYNERVKDLLGLQTKTHGLRVREHKMLGPYVENLSQHNVGDYDEILECINRGNIQRTTASTNMNDTSSRSHAIFTITFVQAVFMNDMPSETVSKIHLVDLAGSERANATGATGQRLKEGAHINKSLVTLGSVISALAEQSNRNSISTGDTKKILYIPYRDSTLTWLLKDSLGGNSKTIMIAAISPADCNYSETLSTLRYANRAKNIINKPTINEDPNVKLIRELRDEINKLKFMLGGDLSKLEPYPKMLEDLQKKEAQEKVLTEEWTEKWKEAQSILQEQKSLGLRKSGVGVVLDSESPHLIGIHNDITTGVTLYSLKEGETVIGSEDSDILLTGDGILALHCTIVLKDMVATLYPAVNAHCLLNTGVIDEPTAITQGDIIILGRTNMFRFNNPVEAAKLQKDLNKSQLDMSRLSLITSSRENLLTSSFYGDDEMSSSMSSPFRRRSEYYPAPQICREPELQDENMRILATIEQALKQLNVERVQMHEQYKNKVRRLADELLRLEKEESDIEKIFYTQQEELLARKEMVSWEKSNEKIQVGIKISDPSELSEEILLQVADSLDAYAALPLKENIKRNKDEIRKLEEQALEKERLLNGSTEKIAKLDEEILDLDNQLANLSMDDIRAKKSSMTLSLRTTDSDVQTDETSDTFHTAQSNSSFSPSSGTSESQSTQKNNSSSSCDTKKVTPNHLMMDSGVYVGEHSSNTQNNLSTDEDSGSCSSCEINSNNNLSLDRPHCSLHILRKKIAAQKAFIMKNLELEIDKVQLDRQINELQDLQKKYFAMEKQLQVKGDHETCCSERKLCDMDLITPSSTTSNNNTFDSPTDDCSIAPSMTRSCPAIGGDNEDENDQFITIPGFVLRGAGKQTHYEYEVRICLADGRLSILRRYSRFRQLHLSMKDCYGAKVGMLSFPRRELFCSNSENVAKHRRRLLELYLRRLLVVCSKIPQSPIYNGPNGPGISKTTLAQLSPFFRKGLFENGKHGTG
ncbi:KIF16B family protein [Megaselia abdita]